jgi:hypothetical protein
MMSLLEPPFSSAFCAQAGAAPDAPRTVAAHSAAFNLFAIFASSPDSAESRSAHRPMDADRPTLRQDKTRKKRIFGWTFENSGSVAGRARRKSI